MPKTCCAQLGKGDTLQVGDTWHLPDDPTMWIVIQCADKTITSIPIQSHDEYGDLNLGGTWQRDTHVHVHIMSRRVAS